VPSPAILARGASFFSTLYGKVARRVMSNMDNSGTEDLGLTARLVYGYVLSNVNVLSPAETSFVLIAGLIPQDLNPQLKGHLRGALNGGATVEEVRAVREIVVRICEEAGMRKLEGDEKAGLGWRGDVANL
jgi:alkylhydroperoxidase/carboxymuconolactone decarboxylase family protein YurZ